MFRRIIHICLISFLPALLSAQEGKLFVERISLEDGLPQGHIFSIAQDSLGFMWFATGGGLARYDGSQIKVYNLDRRDSSSISANWVTELYVDSQNRLWIGTDLGLNLFDRKKGTFRRFQHDPLDETSISDNRVRGVYEDSRGHIWVGTFRSVERFNPETGQFHPVDLPGFQGERHSPNMTEGPNGFIWATAAEGVYKIDPEAMTGYQIVPGARNTRSTSLGFWITPDSTLVALTRYGIFSYDEFSDHFRPFILGPGWEGQGVHAVLPSSEEGIFWVGTTSSGLLKYDYKSRKILNHYTYSPADPESLSNNAIYSMYRDREGNIWIGTFNGGKQDPSRSPKISIVPICARHRQPLQLHPPNLHGAQW